MITSIYSINHQKANKSHPQKTTPWHSARRFSTRVTGDVSIGTGAATAAGAGVLYQLYNLVNNWREGEPPSWWNAGLLLLEGLGTLGLYKVTKPPKNAEDIDLINSSVKDVMENIRGKISDDSSFTRIFSKQSLENLDSASSELLKNTFDVIKKEVIGKYFFQPDDNNAYRACLRALQEKEDPCIELVRVFNPALKQNDQLQQFKNLLKENPGLLYGIIFGNKKIEKKVMTILFEVDSKEEFENCSIKDIRSEINKVLESIGLGLVPVHYDKVNDQVKLRFVTTKGHPMGNSSSDAKLYLGGAEVILEPSCFFVIFSNLVNKLSRLSEDEIAKQLAEGKSVSKEQTEDLTKKILAILGPVIPELNAYGSLNALKVELDPKTGQYQYSSLGPLVRILNDASSAEERKLREIVGKSSGLFPLDMSNPVAKKRGEENEFSFAGGGGRGSGYNVDSGEIDWAAWNRELERILREEAAEEAAEQERLAPRLNKEKAIKDRIKEREAFFEKACKELGIKIEPKENTGLTDFKLALLMSRLIEDKEHASTAIKAEFLSREPKKKFAELETQQIFKRKRKEIAEKIRINNPAIKPEVLEKTTNQEFERFKEINGDSIYEEVHRKIFASYISDEEAKQKISSSVDFKRAKELRESKITEEQIKAEKESLFVSFKNGTFYDASKENWTVGYQSRDLLMQEVPEEHTSKQIQSIKKRYEERVEKLYDAIGDYFPNILEKSKNKQEESLIIQEGKSNYKVNDELSPERCKEKINPFGLRHFLTVALEGVLEKDTRVHNVKIKNDRILFDIVDKNNEVEAREPFTEQELFIALMNTQRFSGRGTAAISQHMEKTFFRLVDPVKAKELKEKLKEIKRKIDADQDAVTVQAKKTDEEHVANKESHRYLVDQCRALGIKIQEDEPTNLPGIKFGVLVAQAKKEKEDLISKEKANAIKRRVIERLSAEKLEQEGTKAFKLTMEKIGKGEPKFINEEDRRKYVDNEVNKAKSSFLDQQYQKIEITYVSPIQVEQIIDFKIYQKLKGKITTENYNEEKAEYFKLFNQGKLTDDTGTTVYLPKEILDRASVDISSEKATEADRVYTESIGKLERVVEKYLPEADSRDNLFNEETSKQIIDLITLKQIMTLALEGKLDLKEHKVEINNGQISFEILNNDGQPERKTPITLESLFTSLLMVPEFKQDTNTVMKYLEVIISALPKSDKLRLEALEIKITIDQAIEKNRRAVEKAIEDKTAQLASPVPLINVHALSGELAGKK